MLLPIATTTAMMSKRSYFHQVLQSFLFCYHVCYCLLPLQLQRCSNDDISIKFCKVFYYATMYATAYCQCYCTNTQTIIFPSSFAKFSIMLPYMLLLPIAMTTAQMSKRSSHFLNAHRWQLRQIFDCMDCAGAHCLNAGHGSTCKHQGLQISDTDCTLSEHCLNTGHGSACKHQGLQRFRNACCSDCCECKRQVLRYSLSEHRTQSLEN